MPMIQLAAHGTRYRPGRDCVDRIRAALGERLGEPVQLAWVDVVEPRLEHLVGDGDLVVPAFLGEGFHVRHDIAHAAAQAEGVLVARHLGTEPGVLDALDARVREAGGPWPLTLLAWAGSRDEGSRAECAVVARTMAARWAVEVRTVTPKTLGETLADVAGRTDVGLALWLLAPGLFSVRFAESGPPCSEPLGEHPEVIEALAHLVETVSAEA